MDWCAKVEKLLKNSLEVGEELRNFKVVTEAQLDRDSRRLDQNLEANGNGLKQLQEESDGLFARCMGFSEDVLSLENEQKSRFSQVDQEIEKEGEAVAQAADSIVRVRDVFAIKNDPNRQFLIPPTTFILDNFYERREKREKWYSPYFYSHRYGYKMQLRVFPFGTGKGTGTHISVFVIIVPGEFDDLLTWPFCGIVTLHLINHARNGLNLVHKVFYTTVNNLEYRERPRRDVDEDSRWGWGTFQLVAQTDLTGLAIGGPGHFEQQKLYLKDNCLTFSVWNIDVFCKHH